ncbi:MAG: glycosyltransferase [Elainella sp. C42_A2020_010]|nr:glycosyltransferase [Elainella sp. C42_A2020_010]RNJ68738.1 MAG: glycosyltransferase [Leptolyngbya sp. IPPAS B-1204]
MPQVSIIIPAYNGERFITKALDSILAQTYSNYEIIVVNDGSTDQTAAVLQPYRDRILYIEQANQGVAAARNRGMALAQGELIAFLDQDDVLLPDKLAVQVECVAQHPEIGIVHSGWRLVDAEGNPLADIEPWHEAPQLDLAGWLKRMPVLLSAMMFRHSWLKRVGEFDSQFKQACDVEIVQRLIMLGCQTAWVPQVTVLYRQHDQNDSLNTLVQAEEVWTVQEQFFARSDIPPTIRQIERECRYYTLIWIAWRLYHTGHLTEISRYLEKALAYRPSTRTEALMQWIELFQRYEAEYGKSLDVQQLTQSPAWQQLVSLLVKPG